MARDSAISKAIYTRYIRHFRLLNDAWIFTERLRPHLEKEAKILRHSVSNVKVPYSVPRLNGNSISKRRDRDIGQMYSAQHDRGIFETNIVSLVSRTEAFIQDSIAIVATAFPMKLSLLAEKSAIPLDLFLEHEEREDVIRRFVAMKCEGLMFGKPSEYLDKATKVLAIKLDDKLVKAFVEIKASRDIIIHNSGRINKFYVEKAGDRRRGSDGEELIIDRDYFRETIITLKQLSSEIQSKTEETYK